jgi:vesicle transport through interaction with t-SNAREs protein 1
MTVAYADIADGYRMYQQKFLSGAIIAVLVILIIIVLWSKLRG